MTLDETVLCQNIIVIEILLVITDQHSIVLPFHVEVDDQKYWCKYLQFFDVNDKLTVKQK